MSGRKHLMHTAGFLQTKIIDCRVSFPGHQISMISVHQLYKYCEIVLLAGPAPQPTASVLDDLGMRFNILHIA